VSASRLRIATQSKPSKNPKTTLPSISPALSQSPDSSPLSEPSEHSDTIMPASTIMPTASATAGAASSSSGPLHPNTLGVSGVSATPGEDLNPQTNPNIPAPTTTRKMPKPGEKNAPTFDPDKPEELGRFFERIEDWFADEGIVNDVDKKRRIVKYLDADSEIQWKALAKFSEGTFEAFRKAVMASYPKADEIMKGSVAALKKKIGKIGPVEADERDELLSLVRIMTAEVLKLKKIQPPIHTNRELVDLFLSRLTPDFASRVASKLSVHRLASAQDPDEDNPVRNTEDMYDIEEVMKMAKYTSLEHANPFGKYLHGFTGSASETNVKLEEAVARLTDSVVLQTQYNKQNDQKLANMQSFMNQPRVSTVPPGYNRGLAPPNNHVSAPGMNSMCFYCRGPHKIADCEDALRHLDQKWIARIDGYIRLPDGRPVPRDGNKSLKEVVESMNQSKPGIIPMSKIQNKAAMYQGNTSAFLQHQVEEDTLRALLELMQKVGPDKVQELLNPQPQEMKVDDQEEWNQNF
jgi:hypothetical protein